MPKLTMKQLEALGPEDHNRKLSDGESVVGKVFVGKNCISVQFGLRFKQDNKYKEHHLGSWRKGGEVTLKDVRTAAAAARVLIAEGKDPSAQKTVERDAVKREQAEAIGRIQSERDGLTLAELVALWIERDRQGKVKDGGAEILRLFAKDLLPKLGYVRACDITRGMIAAELDRVRGRAPIVARYLLANLRQMFRWAVRRELVEADPTYLLELKEFGVKGERERVLSEEEVRTLLGSALEASGLSAEFRLAVRIMLSTLCRVGELLQARWSDVDLERGVWTIPAPNAKNAKEHRIHLSPYARSCFAAILEGQKLQRAERVAAARDAGEPTDISLPAYVMANSKWTGHIDLKSVTKAIRDRQRPVPAKGRAKVANTTLVLPGGRWHSHDLRRTSSTLMRAMGIDSDVIEKCLNHIKKETLKRIYQRPDLSTEMNAAWERLGQQLAAFGAGEAEPAEQAQAA